MVSHIYYFTLFENVDIQLQPLALGLKIGTNIVYVLSKRTRGTNSSPII